MGQAGAFINNDSLSPIQLKCAFELCLKGMENKAVERSMLAKTITLAGLAPGNGGMAIGGSLFEDKVTNLEKVVSRQLPYVESKETTKEEKEAKLLEERDKVMQIIKNNPGMTVSQFLSI